MKQTITPQQIEKTKTISDILNALQNGKLRWRDLKKKLANDVKSSRTLSNHLTELQERGIVRRIIDSKGKGPPAVYYEITSQGKMVMSSVDGSLFAINALMEERRLLRENMLYLVEKRISAEETVNKETEDFLLDFLVTVKLSLENVKVSPYLIYISKELYGARLENILELWRRNPEVTKEVARMLEALQEDRREQQEKTFEQVTATFEDKALAKSVIKLATMIDYREQGKAKITDLPERLRNDKQLRQELEKIHGKRIEEESLARLFNETAWTNLKITKTTN